MAHAQKPDLVFRAKRPSPFKSTRGASVQSTAGSRGVRISGSNAGYTMFRGSVKSTGHPLYSRVSPYTSPTARRRVPSHFNGTLPTTSPTVDRHDKCNKINPLTPNDPYKGRTAPLTSKRCILYNYSTNIGTAYSKHDIYTQFFLFKMQIVS